MRPMAPMLPCAGEWEAVTATFDRDGVPQQLPDRFVPSAFREWGVELCDWQSQCSMLCSADSSELRLQYRLRRMMPTVGCEADAVAYTEDVETLFGSPAATTSTSTPSSTPSATTTTFPTIASDGSYFAGPRSLPRDAESCKLEFCVTQPGSSPASRMRVVVHMAQHWQTKAWVAKQYEVHAER
jgi:hypothetical protein